MIGERILNGVAALVSSDRLTSRRLPEFQAGLSVPLKRGLSFRRGGEVVNKTRSKVRLSRALGIPLTPKAARHLERRPYPPGQHGRRRRTGSDYRARLLEKQRLRAQYNLGEAQLRLAMGRAVPEPSWAAGTVTDTRLTVVLLPGRPRLLKFPLVIVPAPT